MKQRLNLFIANLYKETVKVIIKHINRLLTTKETCPLTINLLDTPGYYGDTILGCHGVYDVIYNGIQDKLNQVYFDKNATDINNNYKKEGIEIDVHLSENIIKSDGYNIAINLLRTVEENQYVQASSLVEKMVTSLHHHDQSAVQRISQSNIMFRHQNLAYPVNYDVTDWSSAICWNWNDHKSCVEILQNSAITSSLFGIDKQVSKSSTLRRVRSIKQNYNANTSFSRQINAVVDAIVENINRSETTFILSIQSNTNCNISNSTSSINKNPLSFELSLVKQQLFAINLLDVCRLYKQGYPDRISLEDFRKTFSVLSSNKQDVKMSDILTNIDLDATQYRTGKSQIFLRCGMLNQLYKWRDNKMSANIIQFQSRCRGYLARKKFEKRKVQDVAIRCLQRNIRLYLNVRQWSWWKLMNKVLPIVQVTRNENQIKEAQAEMELYKEKFSKLKEEKNEIEKTNEKLESKVNDLIKLLEEERKNSAHVYQMLEKETKEKNDVIAINSELSENVVDLQNNIEKLKVENSQKKVEESKTFTSISFDSEEGLDYKSKYELALGDFNFRLKEQKTNSDNTIEELTQNKKALERKLIQTNEEMDEEIRINQINKKKISKLQNELGDLKINSEEITMKNHDLEKKQRKIDGEISTLNKEISELKNMKDSLQREKDTHLFDNENVKKELEEKMEEIDQLNSRIKLIEEELDEKDMKDSDDKNNVNKLKKKLRESEEKISDQEEELDEQAGTIQNLQHTKERLEMQVNQLKTSHSREIQSKDDEYEETRQNHIKKMKSLEEQLEDAEVERSSATKQKRQLEQQLFDLKSQNIGREQEKSLRKDIKRYKTLFNDAQSMIDHLKTNNVSKQQIKQLKTELEESEYKCTAAIKSKKIMTLEIEDLQTQLEECQKLKQDAECRVSNLQQQVQILTNQIEEDKEDTSEMQAKYRQLVANNNQVSTELTEVGIQLDQVTTEKNELAEKVTDLESQIENMESVLFDKENYKRLENKAKDLETKLDFHKTTSRRFEVQVNRLKETNERLTNEKQGQQQAVTREREQVKKLNKMLRDSREEQEVLVKKQHDFQHKNTAFEMELEESRSQVESLQSDLKLAFRRIDNLQITLEQFEDSDVDYSTNESEDSDCEDLLSTRGSRITSISSKSSNFANEEI